MEVLLNCSIERNKNSIGDTIMENSLEFNIKHMEPIFSKLASYGTITVISLAILINIALNKEQKKKMFNDILQEVFIHKNIKRTVMLLVLILLIPFMIVFLFIATVYKIVCCNLIRNNDKYFVGFLDSFDVFWNLEDDSTKSIINVLGIIESNSAEALVCDIKYKLLNILPNERTRKIFYRRNEKYGFFYWRNYQNVDLDQYVQIVDIPGEISEMNNFDLENVMSEVCKDNMPYKDEGLFKILVTQQRVKHHNSNRGDYGIIFRVHHSVGDGVALIEFLCKTLSDQNDKYSMNMFSFPEGFNVKSCDSPGDLCDMIRILCDIPICFVDGILRKPDTNSLHGPVLLGPKVFKWTEAEENLFVKVREIKRNVDNLKFSDILSMALSSGLECFFSKTMATVPEEVAVVLPVRIPKSSSDDNDLKLVNDFSVTILDLPVSDRRPEEIKSRCDSLRYSADPLTNYYFLKLVSGILPRQILQPLLNSSQATMVFSNLPGPESLSICGENQLKSLWFFVPHKGNTGLCVTALSYGGVLRLAAMADSALISNRHELSYILDGMVQEINRLHQRYVH